MELIERFLKYVGFDTQSSEEGEGCPSTDKQMVFARYLENELKAIGLEEVSLDDQPIRTGPQILASIPITPSSQ